MNHFSISQLQQYSGIKAHTIRMWEQRYKALSPSRSEGNVRYYDNTQLRRLLNIVSLMEQEYKVSEVCSMTDEEMFILLELQLKSQASEENPVEYFIAQLIASAVGYDETLFEKVFSGCLLRYGMKDTFVIVIYPMLVRVGLMWANDSLPSAQEHFISNLIRQKLFAAIDALPPVKSSRNSWLLFLPENEFHEIGLLLSAYFIRLSGKKIIYLGSNVPLESLANTVGASNPTHLFFFLMHHDLPENAQEYLQLLSKKFPKQRIHVAGIEKLISQLKLKREMKWIRSVDELVSQVS